MRSRVLSLFLLAGLALATPACKPADAATLLKSSPLGRSASGDAWYEAAIAEMKFIAPAYTRCDYIKLGPTPAGTTAALAFTGDSAVEGEAVGPISTGVLRYFTGALFNLLKTGTWAISWQGKVAVPVSGRATNAGMFNAAGSHGVYMRTAFAISTTKYMLSLDGAGHTDVIGPGNDGTGIVATNGPHRFTLGSNATTISFLVDGAVAASTTVLTNAFDDAQGFFLSATVVTDVNASRLAYCYVDPT
jgi:hypothetical protein